ncbi:SDR family NAD(P)-dependent oxidoreductase [Pseudogemmobacter humi]|uniref:3-oxoacyl-[acyl-carrier-protein] reductase FabG1 n=1 Tax=Pseudogemmobacter humi TaxID=2483812 RepID=A0A3P5WHT3_9RHOB|nr:SDR family oxidoreductase [Pseudogemmobacter humi]VDC19218.1 3-oxoacyl-[acyl-carrier-protein] reductase FabG1 [Pseudogemmobacter humi]
MSGMSGSLVGKTALVTGATSGIGKEVAALLAARGARVACVSRSAGSVSELPTGGLAIAADVGDAASVAQAFERATDALGAIDYVVNAAGVGTPAFLEDLTPELWQREIAINLSGSFYVAREAAIRMKRAGSGSIVLIGSELAHLGLERLPHYCAAKAGILGLTRALALELAPVIRVNCVCPGPVDTPMMETELLAFGGTPEIRQAAIDRVPLKRFADPKEIAEFICFVLVQATFSTGNILNADGGTTAA